MRRSLLSLSACLLVSVLVIAQVASGRIRGVVVDTAGAPLPGVTITLSDNNRVVRTAVSDASGAFDLPNLEAGRYTVTCSLPGFHPWTIQAAIAAGQTREVKALLSVAGLEESLTVSGERRGGWFARRSRSETPAAPANLRFNTESYRKIDDNEWSDVSSKPLSTVSIDVDTASYANVRRFLTDGQRPPADAVRIEELINYFSYGYPEPRADEPFTLTTAIDTCPWNSRNRIALIGLQARHLEQSDTPPRNLVFLVDVSGSMRDPKKLPLVQAALGMLAKNLRPVDRVALVAYAGAEGVVLPSTPGGNPAVVLDAIDSLEAGGPTNGARGIERAYQIARDHFIKGGVNRVVLATDGDFNVGVTSEGDLVRLIEEQRKSGVTLSVLGVGSGNLKDSTMEMLADRGNGNYSYLDSLSEARKVLVEGASGTLVTVAKDVKLQIEMNPRVVSRYRLIGYENRVLEDRDFNDDSKDAGDIGAGHSVTALYELVPASASGDKPDVDPLKYQTRRGSSAAAALDEALTIKIRYKEPDGKTSRLMSRAVPSKTSPSSALGFAAAVAEFGMLLRDSPFKGAASFEHVRSTAMANQYPDPHQYRAEFIGLVEKARLLRK